MCDHCKHGQCERCTGCWHEIAHDFSDVWEDYADDAADQGADRYEASLERESSNV